MTDRFLAPLVRWLEAWVGGVLKRPRLAISGLLLLAVVSLSYAVATLGINTNANEMMDRSLDYRVNQQAVWDGFPMLDQAILLVVTADTPDEADLVARQLVAGLRPDTTNFTEVFSAAADDFFRQNGFLYLSVEELEALANRLGSSSGLLADILADPSPAQLFDNLAFAVRVRDQAGFDSPLLISAFDQLNGVVDGVLTGERRALSWQRLFGADEGAGPAIRIVSVHPTLDYSSLQPAKAALAALREQVAVIEATLGGTARIGITGETALRTEELKTVAGGMELSGIISVVAVALLLAFGVRSGRLVGGALVSLVASIMLTAGFAAITVGELNLISVAFAVLLIGLGIDFSIHLCLNYQEKVAAGLDNTVAIRRAVHQVGSAFCLCAPTTAAAFFAFSPTAFVGMGQLGIISGGGVFIAFFVSVTLLPAWFSLFPEKVRPQATKPLRALTARAVEGYAGPIAFLSLLAGVAAIIIASDVRFDADPMNLRDPQSPAVQAFDDLFETPESIPYQLSVLAPTLDAAEAAARQLKPLDVVDRTITLGSFVPDEQAYKLEVIDFLAGDLAPIFEIEPEPTGPAAVLPALDGLLTDLSDFQDSDASDDAKASARQLAARLADFRAAAVDRPALITALTEDVLRYLPAQVDRLAEQLQASPISLDDLPSPIVDRFVGREGQYRVAVIPAVDTQVDAERRAFVDEVRAIVPDASGPAYDVLRAGEVVASSMFQATLIAGLLGSLILLFFLRNFFTVVLILLPLVLAGVMTVAAGVLLDLPFNFANVIVLPLLIGLGMDSAIHLVMRVRESGRDRNIFSTSTPRAVLLSAMTTIFSFGSLALNDHRGTASMGELLMIAIAFTLIATLVVLPGLLTLAKRGATDIVLPPSSSEDDTP